jgi:hypothetical protein
MSPQLWSRSSSFRVVLAVWGAAAFETALEVVARTRRQNSGGLYVVFRSTPADRFAPTD